MSSLQRAVQAVSIGYGDMTIEGKDIEGTDITITSIKDAPHKRWINEKMRYSLAAIFEAGRAGIAELMSMKLGR